MLLLEDDQSMLDLSEKMLESLGYAVLAAHSRAGAIDLVEGHKGEIGMLVTDVVMPEACISSTNPSAAATWPGRSGRC